MPNSTQAKPITSNKLELLEQENLTLDKFHQDLKDNEKFQQIQVLKAKMGWNSFERGFIDLDVQEAQRNLAKAKREYDVKLANQIGISVDDLNKAEYQKAVEMQKQADTMKIFEEKLSKQEQKYKDVQQKYKESQNFYDEMENETLKLVEGIDDKLTKGSAQFIGGLVEGFADVSNVAKGIAMNYMAGTIATGYGLSKLGSWAVENTLDFAENYYSTKRDAELLGREMTQEELIDSSITSLFMQNVIGLGKKLFFPVNVNSKNQLNQTKNNLMENNAYNEGLQNTTPKEVVKGAYDLLHPDKPTANQQLFANKMIDGADYRPELDPNNTRFNVEDRAYDYHLQAGQEVNYKLSNDGVVKLVPTTDKIANAEILYQANKISEMEFNDIKTQEQYNIEQKLDMEMDIDNGIDIPKGYDKPKTDFDVEEKPTIHSGEIDNHTPIKPTVNENEAFQELHTNGKIGDWTEVINDNETVIEYISPDNKIVKIITDNNRIKDRYKYTDAINYSKIENDFMYMPSEARVEVYDRDGNFINVSGNKKLEYKLLFRRQMATENAVRNIIDLSEEYQARQNVEETNKVPGIAEKSTLKLSDVYVNKERNMTEQIAGAKLDLFRKELGKHYNTITDFLDDVNINALTEMIVRGDTDLPLLKSENANINDIKMGTRNFVKSLIGTDKLVNSLQNKEFLLMFLSNIDDVKVKQMYSRIFSIDENNVVSYNTSPTGFFYNKDVNKVLLDITMNPNKLDMGEYGKDFIDRGMFNFLIGNSLNVDRLNGMAFEVFYKNSPEKINILSKLGITAIDENGQVVATANNFLNGINTIYRELNDPNSSYDKNILKEMLNDFNNKENNLPQRVTLNNDGTTKEANNISLYEYILRNKDNGLISSGDIHDAIVGTINNLTDVVNNYYNEVSKKVNVKMTSEQTRNVVAKTADEANKILSVWSKVFSSDKNQANAYMQTNKFRQEKAKLQKLFGNMSGVIDEKSLDIFEPAKYSGEMNINKLYNYIQDVSKNATKINDAVSNTISHIESLFDEIKKASKNTDFKDAYNRSQLQKEISESLNAIKDFIPKDEFESLEKLLQSPMTRNNLKAINRTFKSVNSTFTKTIDAMKDYSVDNLDSVIKKVRYRNKLLSNINKIGKASDDVIDFIDYTSGYYDHRIPKAEISKNIDSLMSNIKDFRKEQSVRNYQLRQSQYKALQNKYKQFKNVLRENVVGSSTTFFKRVDLNELVSDIKKLHKELGISDENLDTIYNQLNSYKDIIDDINKAKKESTLKTMPQKFVDEYREKSDADKTEMGILETAINKQIWLRDKYWFNQDSTGVLKILDDKEIKNIDDITQVPVGLFEKYVSPEFQEKFKILYNYGVKKFKQVQEIDDNGRVISSRPLSLDEFTLMYARFLDDLTRTTKVNQKLEKLLKSEKIDTKGSISIGALQYYFNNKEDMISFFTNRLGIYGSSYVKSGADLLYEYIDKHASRIAQYNTYGMSGLGFAKTLHTDKSMTGKYINKHRVVSESGNTVKEALTKYASYLDGVAENLEHYYTAYSPGKSIRREKQSNVLTKLSGVLDFVSPILLAGGGTAEAMFGQIRSYNSMLKLDSKFNTVGLGQGNKQFAYYTGLASNVAKSQVVGAHMAGSILYQAGESAVNLLGTLGRYCEIDKAINKMFGTDFKFKIDMSDKIDPITLAIKLDPSKKAMYRTILDEIELKELMNQRHRISMDISKAQQEYDPRFRKKALGNEMYSIWQNTGFYGQKMADIWNAKRVTETMYKQMQDISVTPYKALPDFIQASLKRYGITEQNYDLFLSTLNTFKNEDGDFYDVNLKNLTKEVDIENIIGKSATMVDTIEAFAQDLYQQGFEQNKKLKYEASPDDFQAKMTTFLRRTTAGIGLEDITSPMYRETKTGAVLYKNPITSGLATITPIKFLSYALIGATVPIFNSIAKGCINTVKEVANLMGTIESIEDIIESDDDNGNKFFKSLARFAYGVRNNMRDNIPITSLMQSGNFTDSFARLFGDMTKDVVNIVGRDLLPNNLEAEMFLKRIGYDPDEDISTSRIENLQGIAITLGSFSAFKSSVNLYKALTQDKYEKALKDISILEKDPMFAERRKTAYMKVNKMFNVFNDLEKSKQYSKDTLDNLKVGMPPIEMISDEDQIKLGMLLYKNLYDTRVNLFQQSRLIANQLRYGLNELTYNNGGITKQEYEDNQLAIFKDMKLDDKIQALPGAYKYVTKKILKQNSDLSELNQLQLKNAILSSIQEGDSITDISRKFKLENEIGQPKATKKKYNSFDELPSAYKYIALKKIQALGTQTEEQINKIKNETLSNLNQNN